MKKIGLFIILFFPCLIYSQTIKHYSVDNKGTAIFTKQTIDNINVYRLLFADYIVNLGDSASCINILDDIIEDNFKNRKPHALNNAQSDSVLYDYGMHSYYFFKGNKKSPYITNKQIREIMEVVKLDNFSDESVSDISSLLSNPIMKNEMQSPSFYLEKAGSRLLGSILCGGLSSISFVLSSYSATTNETQASIFIGAGIGFAVGSLVCTISGFSNIRKAGVALSNISINQNGVTIKF